MNSAPRFHCGDSMNRSGRCRTTRGAPGRRPRWGAPHARPRTSRRRDVRALSEGATGTVISIAAPDGRRSMLTDRGVSLGFEPDAFDPAWLDGCDWLHVSAYSLVASPLRETALLAAETARASGAKISLDLASTGAFRQAGIEQLRDVARSSRPDLVFANEAEAEEFGEIGARTVRDQAGRARVHGPSGRRKPRLRRRARQSSSIRQARATRSLPASCSAAPSSR